MSAPAVEVAVVVAVLLCVRVVVAQRENAQLNERLQQSLDFKTEMLQFISHEISNPLTPLVIQRVLMQKAKDEGRPVDATDAQNLEVFARSVARLESLSRDIRSLAQLEGSRIPMNLENCDLVAETQKGVDAARSAADQRGVQVKFLAPQRPAVARLDAQRYGQVVDNLLSNAIKFTPQGGSIDLAVLEAPEVWVLLVQDTGAGLSREQLAQLFTAFGRAHGDLAPGLGLGLVICKGIVEAHGGHIVVESPGPKLGTRFKVTFPQARVAAGMASPLQEAGG